ncbi:hypothetical protein [Nonomuraea cavernae]|uniref:hypothetical protein n=1 Tax=Nonomuraea cavernae TaxID=2045107 RepID=UPI00166EB5F8|nr:hypothetical protein [Nonomuraea cavernae]MCA2183673.1 hypothetical protein [Nonomuraea cavernae]
MLTTVGSLSVTLAVPAGAVPRDDETSETTRTDTTTSETTATDTTTTGGKKKSKRLGKVRDVACAPHVFFKVRSLQPRNFFIPRTRFIDGPGGEMTVSVTREHEVRAFIETENEKLKSITTDDVVRQLRQMLLPHLEVRHMVFVGHDYTQKISKGMYGNMWYRVFGYRVGWSAWQRLDNCRQVRVTTGIANIPSRVEGWRYWETKHPMFKGRILSRK